MCLRNTWISNSESEVKRSLVTKFTLWRLCVPHLTQGSFVPKNQTLQNGFFDIFYVEMPQCRKKS